MTNTNVPEPRPVVTRVEAKVLGLKRYFTGKPCPHGHIAERYIGGKGCLECNVTRPPHLKEKAQEWRNNNKSKQAERDRVKRLNNLEDHRRKGRERQKRNPEKALEFVRRRTAEKLQAMPFWADLASIKKIYKQCLEISNLTGIKHHVDHIIPLRNKNVCGLHIPINLQIIPAKANMLKGNKLLDVSNAPFTYTVNVDRQFNLRFI